MSESPKGTEICDVISGKRYLSIARSYANLNNDSRHVAIMPKKRPGGGGGTSHMKVVRMLVVSLKGVNFGFWSHLGCFRQNAIIFSREGLVWGCTRKNIKTYI